MLVGSRADIQNLATRYPRLLENAYSLTLDYLVAYRTAHLSLVCQSAPERLAQVLISLANGFGQRVEAGIELKIINEELSNEANLTPFTTSRLLSEWQRQGFVLKARGQILLRSPERLLRHIA